MIAVDGIASRILPNSVDGSSAPTSTPFPTPADTDFPSGPYLFQHTKGNLLLAGVAVTKYEDITLKVANKLVADSWEDSYPTTIGAYGRETTLEATLLLKSTPDLVADAIALTKKSVAVTFNNTVNTLGVSLGARAVLGEAPRDLQLGQEYRQKATWKSLWDSSTSTDLVVTNT
jgi:hypothetical protein